jgi:signal transduction histidine kinase
LVHGANAIAAGDLDHRIAHKGKDELSLLASRFNAMAVAVQKSNQVLLEKNTALEEAYRLQSEFLSIVSHELRSPLNSIIGYSELVLEDGDALPPTSAKNVQSIGAGAQRLLSLINDILDFSKLRAGRMEARSDHFCIAELTELVVAETRALARGRDLEIALQLQTELGEMRSAETKVRQILTNLMSNAVKFTPQGSVELHVERGEDAVTFRIRDTGIGVPENQLAIIFEPFRQAQGSDRRAVGGTGLGLAIVARLSKLLGGTVSARSAVGEGTEFTVRLPCYLE